MRQTAKKDSFFKENDTVVLWTSISCSSISKVPYVFEGFHFRTSLTDYSKSPFGSSDCSHAASRRQHHWFCRIVRPASMWDKAKLSEKDQTLSINELGRWCCRGGREDALLSNSSEVFQVKAFRGVFIVW